MKKEKEEVEEPSAPFWMTTFSDMTTLLLVFFILILSYSTIELEKFKGAMSSMKGALGVLPDNGSAVPSRTLHLREKISTQNTGLSEVVKEFQDVVKNSKMQDKISVEITSSGIHIRLGNSVLYDVGKAKIKPQAMPILNEIAKMIKDTHNEVYVEGHTDNIPIHTKKYPSNWELSTARAMSVVHYFYDVEKIPARRLAAVGHGEFRPLVPNDTPQHRAKNRRVEIFIKSE